VKVFAALLAVVSEKWRRGERRRKWVRDLRWEERNGVVEKGRIWGSWPFEGGYDSMLLRGKGEEKVSELEGKRGPSAAQSKSMTFRNLSASPLREVVVSCLSSLCLNSID